MELYITKAHIKQKTTIIGNIIVTYELRDYLFAVSELASKFVLTTC